MGITRCPLTLTTSINTSCETRSYMKPSFLHNPWHKQRLVAKYMYFMTGWEGKTEKKKKNQSLLISLKKSVSKGCPFEN